MATGFPSLITECLTFAGVKKHLPRGTNNNAKAGKFIISLAKNKVYVYYNNRRNTDTTDQPTKGHCSTGTIASLTSQYIIILLSNILFFFIILLLFLYT